MDTPRAPANTPCPIWGEDFWGLSSPSEADVAEWLRQADAQWQPVHVARFAEQLGPDGDFDPLELARYLEGTA